MSRVRVHRAALSCLILASCGSDAAPPPAAPSQPPAEVVVDVPPPPKPPREVVANIAVDAVAIGDEKGTFGSPAGERADLIWKRLTVEPTAALEACLEESRESSRSVFFARVERDRKVSVVKEVAPDAPAGFSACIAKALASSPQVTELGHVALAVDAQVRVPSLPCVGPACPAEAVTGVGGAEDGDVTATGNMWGDEIGDSFGAGGLGLTGIGEGGIGLGSVGTIGHGAGTGTGQGFGAGRGRLGGSHRTKPPSVKMGAVSVQGRLPPEVIQRIVRQNFGRFRMCYEGGLRKDEKLAGTVTVQFEIGKDGAVSKVKSVGTTDLKDQGVVACIVKSFSALSFPQPEGGVVVVKYPIKFAPGEAPKAPTVAGKRFPDVTAEDIASALEKRGWKPTIITAQDSKEFVVLAQKGEAISFVTKRSGGNPPNFELSVYDSGFSLLGDPLIPGEDSLRSIIER